MSPAGLRGFVRRHGWPGAVEFSELSDKVRAALLPLERHTT